MSNLKNNFTEPVYYYRKLKATGLYKCAGHGAEDPSHRAFYLPFFQANQDNDPRFEADCILSEYKGDTFNPPAPEPVVAPEPVHEITQASATTAGVIEDKATGNVRAVIRQFGKVIWIEPTHSDSRAEAMAKAQAQLAGIAPVQQACAEPLTDRELAAYQPKIILDAITNALQKPSHEGL